LIESGRSGIEAVKRMIRYTICSGRAGAFAMVSGIGGCGGFRSEDGRQELQVCTAFMWGHGGRSIILRIVSVWLVSQVMVRLFVVFAP
jgi:hypothetical protein